MKAPVGLLSHKAVLRKQDGVASPRQTWASPDTAPQLCHGGSGFRRSPCRGFRFSGATWLDLSNLVARTEYHSWLVLSTLIFRFFSQNRCTAGISALFLHSAQRKPFALEENPLVFYCILKWFLLLYPRKILWAGFHFCLHLVVGAAVTGSSRPFCPQKAAIQSGFSKAH